VSVRLKIYPLSVMSSFSLVGALLLGSLEGIHQSFVVNESWRTKTKYSNSNREELTRRVMWHGVGNTALIFHWYMVRSEYQTKTHTLRHIASATWRIWALGLGGSFIGTSVIYNLVHF
jgi:hypothetical protein